jgi:hypothetical protein
VNSYYEVWGYHLEYNFEGNTMEKEFGQEVETLFTRVYRIIRTL